MMRQEQSQPQEGAPNLKHCGVDDTFQLYVVIVWLSDFFYYVLKKRYFLTKIFSNEARCADHYHTFSAFWLRSSVVSVLISMTTDMLRMSQ